MSNFLPPSLPEKNNEVYVAPPIETVNSIFDVVDGMLRVEKNPDRIRTGLFLGDYRGKEVEIAVRLAPPKTYTEEAKDLQNQALTVCLTDGVSQDQYDIPINTVFRFFRTPHGSISIFKEQPFSTLIADLLAKKAIEDDPDYHQYFEEPSEDMGFEELQERGKFISKVIFNKTKEIETNIRIEELDRGMNSVSAEEAKELLELLVSSRVDKDSEALGREADKNLKRYLRAERIRKIASRAVEGFKSFKVS